MFGMKGLSRKLIRFVVEDQINLADLQQCTNVLQNARASSIQGTRNYIQDQSATTTAPSIKYKFCMFHIHKLYQHLSFRPVYVVRK